MKREDSAWWSAGFTQAWWLALDALSRAAFLEELSDDEAEAYFRDWRVWANDYQLPPETDWRTWGLVAGRGAGKTRAAVEFIDEEVEAGRALRIAIVGQGEDDIRQVMIDGDSGFINCAPSWNKPKFYPSVGGGQLHWPNGAVGFVYSAEDPESLRGPQFDLAWFDEPMAVPADKREKTVSNLRFGLRLGAHPRLIYTTTPKKHRWMQKLLADAADPKKKIALTRASTYDNRHNLADSFIEGIFEDYEGTRLGRQELYGELLGDEEGALWSSETLDQHRQPRADPHEVAKHCEKIVVGVDPNTKANGTAHAAGVIVVGKMGKKRVVLADRSTKGGPLRWGEAAVKAADEFKANEIVAEANQGGEMVRITIHQAADQLGQDVRVILTHASRGKTRRAEPAAASYERGLVSHIGDAKAFDQLEQQMTSLHDGSDPTGEDFDRVDALVWALSRLGLKKSSLDSSPQAGGFFTFGDFQNGGARGA